jgi:broad specificity phosphatase PhoE
MYSTIMNKYFNFRNLISLGLVVSMLGWWWCTWPVSLTTVILVRHGDRTGENLNELGIQRAQTLARVLGESNVQVIYASSIPRTQETARPLANQLGLTINIYDPNNLAALASEIKSQHRGKTILVVGHSDTVSPTIELLGHTPGPGLIPGAEFDNMYLLTYNRKSRSKLIKMKYGAATQ